MHRDANPLRAKLQRGELVHGAVVYSWSPSVVEVAGLAGLDFVRLDTEHAWRRDDSAEHLVRAASLAGVTTVVRVDKDSPVLVRKALEIGAGAVIVPDIRTPAEAAAVVAAGTFPPRGTRGYNASCLAGGWGTGGGQAWVEWSDREPMIGVMIETPEAVEQIEAIVALDGLDFVLFGPADLSMNLGFRQPQVDHLEVQRALARTTEVVRGARKHVMYGAGRDPERIRQAIALGVDMLEHGSDVSLLSDGWRAVANAGTTGSAGR